MTEVNVIYSLFCTEEGEYFTGCATQEIDDISEFIGTELIEAMKTLLRSNPNKVFSLVIECNEVKGDGYYTP